MLILSSTLLYFLKNVSVIGFLTFSKVILLSFLIFLQICNKYGMFSIILIFFYAVYDYVICFVSFSEYKNLFSAYINIFVKSLILHVIR